MVKHLISYLLLLIFTFNLLVFYPALVVVQNRIQQEMKVRVGNTSPLDAISFFTFSYSQFSKIRWIKPASEFVLNGKMYDLVRIEKNSNGNITIFALDDKKEKNIVSLLENHHKDNLPNTLPSDDGKVLLKLISNIYYLITNKISILIPSGKFTSTKDITLVFNSFIGDIPYPPPKQV